MIAAACGSEDDPAHAIDDRNDAQSMAERATDREDASLEGATDHGDAVSGDGSSDAQVHDAGSPWTTDSSSFSLHISGGLLSIDHTYV
jgi:hypothetical protein